MLVNKYRFTIPENDEYINIPLEIKWDFGGRDDSIDLFEEDVIEEVIGKPTDFEILRFAHEMYDEIKSNINYEFNFYSGTPQTLSTSVISDWVSSYLVEGFNALQLYYFEKPFTKSFFKLDFYDTNDISTQTNYFTIIIPVQQGFKEEAIISPVLPKVNVRKPRFKLDFLGDTEGFYIYWLRDVKTLDIKTFYMTAKFFNARLGGFMRFMNRPQSTLTGNKYLFNESDFFYYRVELNYNNKTYQVFNKNARIGMEKTPIKWYEYVNQP